jgi:hypothetical protein
MRILAWCLLFAGLSIEVRDVRAQRSDPPVGEPKSPKTSRGSVGELIQASDKIIVYDNSYASNQPVKKWPPAPSKQKLRELVASFAALGPGDQAKYLQHLRRAFLKAIQRGIYRRVNDDFGKIRDTVQPEEVGKYWFEQIAKTYKGYSAPAGRKVQRIAAQKERQCVKARKEPDADSERHELAQKAYNDISEFVGKASDYVVLDAAVRVQDSCGCSWIGCAGVHLYSD